MEFTEEGNKINKNSEDKTDKNEIIDEKKEKEIKRINRIDKELKYKSIYLLVLEIAIEETRKKLRPCQFHLYNLIHIYNIPSFGI